MTEHSPVTIPALKINEKILRISPPQKVSDADPYADID
jgi:hypothetical protein